MVCFISLTSCVITIPTRPEPIIPKTLPNYSEFPKIVSYYSSHTCKYTLRFLEISEVLGHHNRLNIDYLSQKNWNCKMLKKSCC